VYRADVVTSGRITPTMPLPAAVAPVNWAIAEKSAVNDVAVSVTAAAVGAGVGVAAGEGVALLLHAPATIAVIAIAARNLELDLMKLSPPAP
jgi:hypothetical protein